MKKQRFSRHHLDLACDPASGPSRPVSSDWLLVAKVGLQHFPTLPPRRITCCLWEDAPSRGPAQTGSWDPDPC